MKYGCIAFICLLLLGTGVSAQNYPMVTAGYRAVPSLRHHLPIDIPEARGLSDKDIHSLECLAWNLYFEARGGDRLEKIAVAWVPINRMNAKKFAADICTNVFQYIQQGKHRSWQFSWAKRILPKTFKREDRAWSDVQKIAYQVLHGKLPDPSKGALYFHHKDVPLTFTPRGGRILLGSHYFYR